jgi:glycyl-tRNA synthetase beta chain
MAKDLLLEIGTEEIPAGFMPHALESLKRIASISLEREHINFGDVAAWGTPRRLALHVRNIDEKQENRQDTHLGPPLKYAKDEQGNYTKAALGFAEKLGIKLEDLKIFPDPKGDRLGYVKKIEGQPVVELLPQIIPGILEGLSFPKSMRWGEGLYIGFARPIRWVMAIFGEKTIEFEVPYLSGLKETGLIKIKAGDKIISSDKSYGHRFLAPQAFRVTNADSGHYRDELRRRFVIVDQRQRKAKIIEQLEAVGRQLAEEYAGAKVIRDEKLLDEVTYLVEYPVAVTGQFDKEFLKLPREVLTTTLKHHQKCFCVEDEKGNLLPVFITISNMPDEKGYIRQGNERVIKARLADARFFFEEDRKKPLVSRLEALDGMIFQEKLGSYYEKTMRLEELAGFIAQKLGAATRQIDCAKQAARLCKCDLVTEMVGEFPELQGIIGGHYACLEGYDVMVCNAIKQQYNFDMDDLPSELPSVAVNMADKMDSIVGYTGIGILPSGSQDPYAIKRQVMSIVDMLLEKIDTCLSLNDLINKALKLYGNRITRTADEVHLDIERLFRQRLEAHSFKDIYRYDLVNAVLDAGFDDVVDARERLEALNNLGRQADFDSLMIAFRRVARIIPPNYKPDQVEPDLLSEEAEKALYNQFQQIKGQVEQLLSQRDYAGALKTLADLRPDVDRFFDDVLVMSEDEALRNNRLALLSGIKNIFSRIADFSKIVVQYPNNSGIN